MTIILPAEALWSCLTLQVGMLRADGLCDTDRHAYEQCHSDKPVARKAWN